MMRFHYTAKKSPQQIIDGTVQAEDRHTAVHKIMQLGLMPVDIEQAPEMERPRLAQTQVNIKEWLCGWNFSKIKLKDTVAFTQEMSDLTEASVPILKSLQIVSQQTRKPAMKAMIDQMYGYVQDGGSFADALGQHPRVFSSFYINMVRAGELSSQLRNVLSRLADYLEKKQETQSKIMASLAYPLFLLVVGIVTLFVLMTFVIPRLSLLFDDLDQSLPLPTVVITEVSGFCAQYWWLLAGLLVAAVIALIRTWQTPSGRRWLDHWQLRVPLFKEFVKVFEIGRFARTLGTLVASGVPINAALDSVWKTMNNVFLKEEIQGVSEDVTQGASLQQALQSCRFFPDTAINVISVGEETGHLERSLFKIAETYERKSDRMVKTMLSLLGPICLVIIVSVVGFVVIALLLPIFQMNLLIQ
jgi:type II secretory pathway component PulF